MEKFKEFASENGFEIDYRGSIGGMLENNNSFHIIL